MRKVLEITFSGVDFQMVFAASEQEALDRLYDSQASIALVDITLGHTSGYDLCQKIKGASPGTRVLLMSSKQNPYDTARGAAVGADEHVDKPFDTQAMIDKVRNLAANAPAPQAVAPRAEPVFQAPAPAYVVSQTQPVAPAEPPVFDEPEPYQPAPAYQPEPAYQPAPAAYAEPPVYAEPAVQPAFTEPVIELVAPKPVSAPPPKPRPAVAAEAPPAPLANGQTPDFSAKLGALGLTPEQVHAVLALSREVVEQAVWEVVPTLAETLIREEIQRLTRE